MELYYYYFFIFFEEITINIKEISNFNITFERKCFWCEILIDSDAQRSETKASAERERQVLLGKRLRCPRGNKFLNSAK
jgi:hypothetical protein